jgi:PIN domain nuclease of toxin-antitoxin system
LKLLLDTHAALWWLAGDKRFSEKVSNLMTDTANQVLLSAAVAWEVAIKSSLGKLDAPDDFAATLLGAGAQALPVSIKHAETVKELPWHHRDPFDRLLIAQAMIESAAVATHDGAFHRYGIQVIW